MPVYLFLWNDGEDGNIRHLAEHGVTPEEAEHVVENPEGHGMNRNGDPMAFGYTPAGRHLTVVYWFADEHATTVYVETAYDTPPRRSRNRS